MMRNDLIMLECLEKEIRLMRAELDEIEKRIIILQRHAERLTDKDTRIE